MLDRKEGAQYSELVQVVDFGEGVSNSTPMKITKKKVKVTDQKRECKPGMLRPIARIDESTTYTRVTRRKTQQRLQ
jgi:hypothetical protein